MTTIGIFAPERSLGSSMGVTLDMLSMANLFARKMGRKPLSWKVLGTSKEVSLTNGLSVAANVVTSKTKLKADVLVVPGMGLDHPDVQTAGAGIDERYSEKLLLKRIELPDIQIFSKVIRRHYEDGGIACGSCSGVLVLGEAGILKGRTVTTNHRLAAFVANRYETLKVDVKRMIVEDERVLTGGAAMAQMDVMLKLISQAMGVEVANQTMSSMLIQNRTSQARYMAWNHLKANDELTRHFENLVEAHISDPMSIVELAKKLNVTEKTLSRKIRASVGHSPKEFLQMIRMRHVQNLLDTTRLTLDEVSSHVGLAGSNSLRKLTGKYVSLTPGAMRRGDKDDIAIS